jgi:hypothetical protein
LCCFSLSLSLSLFLSLFSSLSLALSLHFLFPFSFSLSLFRSILVLVFSLSPYPCHDDHAVLPVLLRYEEGEHSHHQTREETNGHRSELESEKRRRERLEVPFSLSSLFSPVSHPLLSRSPFLPSLPSCQYDRPRVRTPEVLKVDRLTVRQPAGNERAVLVDRVMEHREGKQHIVPT